MLQQAKQRIEQADFIVIRSGRFNVQWRAIYSTFSTIYPALWYAGYVFGGVLSL